jgi:hypothetical protein
MRYGYKQDAHYHPVYKVHNLQAQKGCTRAAANWCDFCCKTVGTSGGVGKAHLMKCCQKACETPATTLEREFLTKWNNKHQPAFRFPPKNYVRQDKFCVLCNQFMEGLTHDDVEPAPQTEEAEVLTEEDESKGTQAELFHYPGGQTEYPEYPIEEACPICGITLHTLYITHCTICNEKVRLGDTRKGMLKHEFQNRHRCICGNKKKLKIAEESSYYIWDMECFTDPVVVREGSPHEEAMVVREHKPIFVVACNLADPSDRISFYGEDCLHEFLKRVLQDKKFKKTTFLAHNAGGYDCQFVMRWLERHGQKSDTVPSHSSLYRPLQLSCDQVRFIDSWNFITIPLGKLGSVLVFRSPRPISRMGLVCGGIRPIEGPCLLWRQKRIGTVSRTSREAMLM